MLLYQYNYWRRNILMAVFYYFFSYPINNYIHYCIYKTCLPSYTIKFIIFFFFFSLWHVFWNFYKIIYLPGHLIYFILVFDSTVDYWSSKFDEGNYFYLSLRRAALFEMSAKGLLTHGKIISFLLLSSENLFTALFSQINPNKTLGFLIFMSSVNSSSGNKNCRESTT